MGAVTTASTKTGSARSTRGRLGRGEFSVSAWGIYTKQKLLITCDSRASAEALLDPDETLVRVVARCTPAKKRRK